MTTLPGWPIEILPLAAFSPEDLRTPLYTAIPDGMQTPLELLQALDEAAQRAREKE